MSAGTREPVGMTALVASFRVAFLSHVQKNKMPDVCIKYAMHDGSFRLSHWLSQHVESLYKCVEYYSATHYYGSDMQRVSDDPELVTLLPARHPVRTMANEKPDLTEGDYGTARDGFSIQSFHVADQGRACAIYCAFADNTARVDVLPEFVVMNLYGCLRASINLSDFMSIETRGTA